MRFVFKTRYQQDINIWRHGGDLFWYGALLAALVVLPALLSDFFINEIAALFIWAVAGIGLMILVGFTGLISLGHAAFLGIGAYCHAYLLSKGVPFLVAMPTAAIVTTAAGVAVGVPTLRMTGIYLAIATLAFAIIVEHVFANWDSVTGGYNGLAVEPPDLFGYQLTASWEFYYLCLLVLILVIWLAANLIRSPTGRALVAIRDSEISAQSIGVNLAKYKTIAFAVSAGITGLGGALFAHYVQYLSPDAFNILLSIQLVLMVVVGGVGSLHGAVFGAVFVGLLPQAIAIMRDYLPQQIATAAGLEPGIFGLVLVYVILLEPLGIYGRWMKIRFFFDLFPLYKKATFKRQKTYLKSERLR